ncbi:hypothetical protein [Brevibacterium epidermidis]|uniref:hypothetical protein n=1 Tax=Brevibacterium epidermidis TaxID=1698 RepID=UPI00130014D0|nr:hypothetical protein [Brevibacterium epidermidis]
MTDANGNWVEMPVSGHIVYMGNGATSQSFDEEFRLREIPGMQTSNGSGSGKYMGVQLITDDPSSTRVINGFSHSAATLVGFHARQKNHGKWHWYTEAGQWADASAEMGAKRLFQPGDDLSVLGPFRQGNLVLDAQWVDAAGNSANCGTRMFSNKLMAHALGGYQGTSNHNTRRAFEHALENGYRYFEVDLSYTSDGRLVAGSWTRKACERAGIEYSEDFAEITYERAMSLKPYGEPMMDARELYELVKQHPECSFELDFHKVEGDAVKNRVKSLLEDFQYDDEALGRLLIQTYTRKMHRDIDSVYRFTHYQYLVGKIMGRFDEIATYCLDTGICAIALRWNLATSESIAKAKGAGLRVLAYTIKKEAAVADALIAAGVDTICTDHVTLEELDSSRGLFAANPYTVVYHSGSSEATERYSAAIEGGPEGEIRRVGSGALEFRDTTKWANDGRRTLLKCRFSVTGKRFVGWRLRVTLDGVHQWYCADGTFRTKELLKTEPPVVRKLFSDEEAVPIVNALPGAKFVMVAVWESVPNLKNFLSRWFKPRR